jgi:glutathione S-transferase
MYSLYVIPGSHPCRSAMLMLEHKQLPYRRVDLVTLLHPRAVYHLQHVLHGNVDAVVEHVVQFMLYSLGARSVHTGDE